VTVPDPTTGVPTDTATALYVQLGRLVRVLRREGEGVPFGPGSMSAMVTLTAHDDGLRLGELADAEGVAPPTLTRIVKALERDGYVGRTPDPDDGRAQRVALTAEGRALITGGTASRIAVLRRRLDALPEDDRRRLEEALPVLEALVAVPVT
jgi:DNA-binding MarR family transcriptional regulator